MERKTKYIIFNVFIKYHFCLVKCMIHIIDNKPQNVSNIGQLLICDHFHNHPKSLIKYIFIHRILSRNVSYIQNWTQFLKVFFDYQTQIKILEAILTLPNKKTNCAIFKYRCYIIPDTVLCYYSEEIHIGVIKSYL